VLAWLRETADVRIHGTTQERPCDRFASEQAALGSLAGRAAFDTSYLSQRLVNREGFVGYRNTRYAVPPAHAGRVVLVKESEDGRLRIFAGAHCIADYPLAGPQQHVVDFPEHRAAVRAVVRSRSLPAAVPSQPTLPAWPQVEVRALADYDAAAGLGGA
jgi:hypothetical protein